MTKINCYTLKRDTLEILSVFQCADWEVNVDYLTNEKSYFVPLGGVTPKQGNFIVAKHGDFDRVDGASFKPFYFGVIDSFDNGRIITCDLYNLLNFDFAAVRMSGSNVAAHLQQMITQYLLNDTGKAVHNLLVEADDSSVAYSYQPSEPPTSTNMVEYLIGCFEKYNVVWSVDFLTYGANGALMVSTSVKFVQDMVALKNNTHVFQNWDVYVNPGGGSDYNKLVIVSKATSAVLAIYYIKIDGTFSQTLVSEVHRPTRDKIYIYDTEAADLPSYLEVARSELSASKYAHEINFDLIRKNSIISFDELNIGTLTTIVYNDEVYQSVLTGYLVKATNDFISLRFGNIRSTFQQVLQTLRK